MDCPFTVKDKLNICTGSDKKQERKAMIFYSAYLMIY